MTALQHPNIVSTIEVGSVDDTHFIVMDYIDGQELSDYLRSKNYLGLDEARPLLRDLAAALDYAHGLGFVHRDVKPSNVMLKSVDEPKNVTPAVSSAAPYKAILMDFGIAKIIEDATRLTETGMMGTLDYLAPEQILNARQVDNRTDVYALGVLLYQLLTGELPFKGGVGQVVFAHLQQPPPDPRSVRAEIPENIAMAVIRAMAKEPDDRPQSAGELIAALN
jgi:serine/threonine-protein kinase